MLTNKAKHSLTIGAIAKNERRYILEWIGYHLAIGADQIIVYSNDTEDDQDEILAAIAAKDRRVSWLPWPSVSGISPQISAYNDALAKAATEWIAFVDIDEFIVPLEDGGLRDWLATVPDDVSTVHVNWRGFGSSGRLTDDYDLVTRTFEMAAPVQWSNNHHFKSFGRVARAREAHIHNIIADTGRRVLSDFGDFETVSNGISNRIVHHRIQVNHYQCKTYAEFQARMRRGLANVPSDHPERHRDGSAERFAQLDLNHEPDRAIRRFDGRVDKELAWLTWVTSAAKSVDRSPVKDARPAAVD